MKVVDYWAIINKHIRNPWTKDVYITHVSLVTAKAIKIATKLNLEKAQVRFIEEAAMLHDIGIIKVNAPNIGCSGDLDYICHGTEGRSILEAEGLPKHALVCERHTGVGIPISQIVERKLPIPVRDMLAKSMEEKIISWADLFFSKTPEKLLYEKSLDEAFDSIKDYGDKYISRFNRWRELFHK